VKKYKVCTRQVNSYIYHVEATSPSDAYHKVKRATIDEKRSWVVTGKSEDEHVIEADELPPEKE
jgi:cation diffusion facilitator CzcD-associated flavoprotein CzcO